MSKEKTYMLLPHMHPTANVYVQVNEKDAVRLDRLPSWKPFLQTTFTDKNDRSRTARLKLNCDTIWQDEQIQKGIPANERFTEAERNAVRFRYGVLVTDHPMAQKYLEAIPQFDEFEGISAEGLTPCYKLLDQKTEVNEENKLIRRRVKAASYVLKMSLQEAKNALILINGSFYKPSNELEECQNALINMLDQSDEVMDTILAIGEGDTTLDDQVLIMIGVLIDAGILSFDAVPDQISKKRGHDWVAVKKISSTDYDPVQRLNHLVEFLTTPDGKPLHDDLKREYQKVVPSQEPEDKEDRESVRQPQPPQQPTQPTQPQKPSVTHISDPDDDNGDKKGSDVLLHEENTATTVSSENSVGKKRAANGKKRRGRPKKTKFNNIKR